MFFAQFMLYAASVSFMAGDNPPDPGTVFIVWSFSSYLCTEATWMAILSETML